MKTSLVFEKTENVLPLSLSELKLSLKQTEANGALPKSRPVEHFQFIENICEIADKANLKPTIEDIWVSKSDSKRVPILDPEKEGLLKSWLFQRLVCRINLASSYNENYNTSIGIGYNTQGMTLVMGTNVMVCSNMSIFGDNMLQTFGNNKILEYPKIMDLASEWIMGSAEKHVEDVGILEQMKTISLSSNGLKTIIGDLHTKAVWDAYFSREGEGGPLNITQVSVLSKNILKEHRGLPTTITLNEAYNICTNIVKPHNADITDIWQRSRALGNYFAGQLN